MLDIIENDLEDNYTNFLVYDIKTNILNGIRRILFSQYKTHAINKNNILIKKNTTFINNQNMQHRISMIPVNTTEECKLYMRAKNETDNLMNLYTKDLNILKGNITFNQDILLLQLNPGQEIEFECTTNLGCGDDCSNYRPITTCYFKIIRQFSLRNDLDNIEEIREFLSNEYELYENNKVYKNIENKTTVGLLHTIRAVKPFLKKLETKFGLTENDYDLCYLYYNKIPVYSFTIESIFLEPTKLINDSIILFKETYKNFLNLSMEVEEEDNKVQIFLTGQTSTLLNTISYFLREDEDVVYSLYNKPHPLIDSIILEIIMKPGFDYIKSLKKAIYNIIDYLDNIST